MKNVLKLNSMKFEVNAVYNSYEYWKEWMEKAEVRLREEGYRKFNQNLRGEDFTYWKTFLVDGVKAYMTGVLFYDFMKYDHPVKRIGTMYECMLLGDNRVDLTVSKEMELEEFEDMSKVFYESMRRFL